jgi:hypothetical protein
MERTSGGYEVKSGSTLQYSAEGVLLDSYDATYCELELWALVQAQERQLELENKRGKDNMDAALVWQKRAMDAESKELVNSSQLQAQERDGSFVRQILELLAHDRCTNLIWWERDGKIGVGADCSDCFFWGSADAEEITPDNLKLFIGTIKFCEDMEATNEGACPTVYADELFAARIRKQRPQGASYEMYPPCLWAAFDACGPVRETGLGNPHKQPASLEDVPDRFKAKRAPTYEEMRAKLQAQKELTEKFRIDWAMAEKEKLAQEERILLLLGAAKDELPTLFKPRGPCQKGLVTRCVCHDCRKERLRAAIVEAEKP